MARAQGPLGRQGGFLGVEHGRRVRADDGHIGGVHQDHDHGQGEDLVDEFHGYGEVLFH